MAKINYIQINNTKKYIENVAYLTALPVATQDGPDFVSVNNELYVKQTFPDGFGYEKVGIGGGDATNDTAYVSNSTLYIEEGTTAGGGGLKVVKITEFAEIKNATVEITEDRYNECANADVLEIVVPDALANEFCYKERLVDLSAEGFGVATNFALPTPYAYNYKDGDDYTNKLVSGFDFLKIGVAHRDNAFYLELTLEEIRFKTA